MSKLKLNSNNNVNHSNLSNIFNLNTEKTKKNYSYYLSNGKNSLANNILDNIIGKISSIPKKIKKAKISSESCSVILTEGNLKKNIQKRQLKDLNSNSKKNKILITEIKINKTNSRINKINKNKKNSIYYNRNNIIKNSKDIFDINKNNIIHNLGHIFKTNFIKKKKSLHLKINNKFNSKRNRILSIKSSHHSVKIEKNNPNLLKFQNDNNSNHNNTNKIMPYANKNYQKNIKSINKNCITNISTHNSVNNTSTKINNLFDKKRNLKLNKKKHKNNHSISSVIDKNLSDNKFNSSVIFNIRKLKLNENEKSINKSLNNNILERYIKNSEKTINNKEKNDKQKLKYFISYNSKGKKINNQNLKNINNNNKNDNQLINGNQKKNNIFFTINKTIIHNMNNTFNNSNNKHYITNINNSTEEVNKDIQFSPLLLKNKNDNNNLYSGINMKKKILSRCQISNNYNIKNNSNRVPLLKINENDKNIKNVQNKGKKSINKNIEK